LIFSKYSGIQNISKKPIFADFYVFEKFWTPEYFEKTNVFWFEIFWTPEYFAKTNIS
jgi:hypothetical protein